MQPVKQIRLDKIIAVESLLHQLEIMDNFGYEKVVIIESGRTEKVSIENELLNLFGFEDLGVVTLFKAPKVVQSRFNIDDVINIEQLWTMENVYCIDITLTTGNIKILYKITPRMVVVG